MATEQQSYNEGSMCDPPMLAGKPMMKATHAHLVTRIFSFLTPMDSFQPAGFLSDSVITALLVRPICSEANGYLEKCALGGSEESEDGNEQRRTR